MRPGPRWDDHVVQDVQGAAAADSAATAADLLGSGKTICGSGENAEDSPYF